MGGGDDDDVGRQSRAAHRGCRAGASHRGPRRAAARALGDESKRADERVLGAERLGPLAPDQAAARRSRPAAARRLTRTPCRRAPRRTRSRTTSSVRARRRHRLAGVLRVARVDEQEAAAAGADQLAADRAAAAGQRVELVDVLARHPGRALALVLPVLVHQLGVAIEVAGEQQVAAAVAHLLGRGAGSRASRRRRSWCARPGRREDRRGAARLAGVEEQQVVAQRRAASAVVELQRLDVDACRPGGTCRRRCRRARRRTGPACRPAR